MDIERALKRRAAMLARIQDRQKFGMLLPEDRILNWLNDCPEAVYGHHGDPNWRGRCPYCDKFLRSRPRINTDSNLERADVFKIQKGSEVRAEIEHLRTFGENTDDFLL